MNAQVLHASTTNTACIKQIAQRKHGISQSYIGNKKIKTRSWVPTSLVQQLLSILCKRSQRLAPDAGLEYKNETQ